MAWQHGFQLWESQMKMPANLNHDPQPVAFLFKPRAL